MLRDPKFLALVVLAVLLAFVVAVLLVDRQVIDAPIRY